MSPKKKKSLEEHKWERQVRGSKPREKDSSLHTVLRLLLHSPCCRMLKFTWLRKVWNSWKRVYTKSCFGPVSSWAMSHWSLGKYCWEILLHTHPCLHPFVSAFTIPTTLFLGALHCCVQAQRKLQADLLLLTPMQYWDLKVEIGLALSCQNGYYSRFSLQGQDVMWRQARKSDLEWPLLWPRYGVGPFPVCGEDQGFQSPKPLLCTSAITGVRY